jgi:hypothetical protein
MPEMKIEGDKRCARLFTLTTPVKNLDTLNRGVGCFLLVPHKLPVLREDYDGSASQIFARSFRV